MADHERNVTVRVYLTETEHAVLKVLCAIDGGSRSETVGRLIRSAPMKLPEGTDG